MLKPLGSPDFQIAAPPAMIMAAGRGNRLLPLTHDRPKCLVEVGGETLLAYQVRALRAAGVERIEIVTGHGAALVERACEPILAADPALQITFTMNELYETTSSLYSFGCLASKPDPAGFLVLNSDVLFHPNLLRRLIDDPREQVLLSDFGGKLGEEEMKITIDTDYRITAISKTLDPTLAQAENLGVLKVGRYAALRMLELARDPRAHDEGLCWIPDAINALRDEIEFHALSTAGLPWIEIDYHHDLKRAREKVWPTLAGAYKFD